MISQALFSSRRDDWETPQDFFRALDAEFHFTLDAAASAENAKCARYYTPQDDGLSKNWGGCCWCNPPYGRDVGRWVRKGLESAESGATVVMLLPARTDTRWFHEWIYGRAEVRFVRGRLHFSGGDSAPFPSMVVIFRPPERSDKP